MKQFISFSGGVESSAMCVLFAKTADAIFADTQFEHQQIYDRIDLIENWCKANVRKNFKIHRVVSEKGSLMEHIRNEKLYPSFQMRFCTGDFKIKPIEQFLKQYKEEGCEILIGLNYDEKDKRVGNHGLLPFVKYSYPLINNGLTRQNCKDLLTKAGLMPQFPVFMKRGGCIGCYYKSKKEYLAMAHLDPETFNEVLQLENDINSGDKNTRKKFFTILGDTSMQQIKDKSESELFDSSDIYPAINDVTSCGVFCNR